MATNTWGPSTNQCDPWWWQGTSATTNEAWPTWVSTTASTATTIWCAWQDEDSRWPRARQVQPVRETPEQKAAREQQLRRYEEERRKRERLARQAQDRAERLLVAHLDDDQRKEYEAHRRFHVVGADGKRYEVDAQRRMHNVYELNAKGERTLEHCIYARGDVPLADNALAQKLMLETDVSAFVRIANQTRLRRAGVA